MADTPKNNPNAAVEPLKMFDNLYYIGTRGVGIYVIKTSGKYHTFQRMYQRSDDRLYARADDILPPVHVLTEDSRAGYQFYQHFYDGTSVQCHSAGSNSGVFAWLQKHHDEGVT